MNNPFLKYIMKDEKEDIFHSSAYGKAQSGVGMGVTSGQSFEKRRELEGNRQRVGGYSRSMIANNALGNGPKAKTYTPPVKNAGGISGKR